MRGFGRFIPSEGFATANQTQETQNIRNYFAIATPNIFANNDPNLNTVDVTKTSNPYVSSKFDNVLDPRRRTNISAQVGVVNEKNTMCQGSDSNQFKNLSNLAASQTDPQGQYCGWVYDNNNPDNGGGAFGTVDGPINTDKRGTWMWNLADAKKKYHTSICSRITSCADIEGNTFSGLCGWCDSTGKGVPINSNNTLAYPTGEFTSCSNSLITNRGSCPTVAPIPAGSVGGSVGSSPVSSAAVQPGSSAALASPSTCPTDSSPLSRDCLLQKLVGAGCDKNGTLWSALVASSASDYTSVLSQNTAFQTYQTRASPAMNQQGLQNGTLTVASALDGFTRVKSVADSTASGINLGLKAAAKDLCYSAGSIDSYDFCAELNDSSQPPFSINCLQKQFLRTGGQYAGTDFPLATMSTKWWASMTNWGQVKSYIQQLYDKTRSQTRSIQTDAMKRFYGINLMRGMNNIELDTLTVCMKGNTYKKLGSYRFLHVGWPWPAAPPDGQIFIAGGGFPINGKWDHLSGRNETWSQIGLSIRDLEGVDIRPIMNKVGSTNNIQLYPGDPTTNATVNYYIKSQTSNSYILLVGNGITSTWVGGPGGYVNIIGRNGNRGNFKEQFAAKSGNGPRMNEIYDIYYSVSIPGSGPQCVDDEIEVTRTPLTTVGNGEWVHSGPNRVFFQDNNVSPSEYALGPRAVPDGFPRAPEGVGYKFYDAPTGGKLLGIVTGYALRQDSGRFHRYVSIIITFDRDISPLLGPLQTVYYEPPSAIPSTRTWNAETTKCIRAVEQTGFIPRITWGQTPPSDHNANCDNVLCPWFKEKYGSYDNVPNTYVEAINYCKSRGL
jgi:hypothetical protein